MATTSCSRLLILDSELLMQNLLCYTEISLQKVVSYIHIKAKTSYIYKRRKVSISEEECCYFFFFDLGRK
jgi:hypothetical protein